MRKGLQLFVTIFTAFCCIEIVHAAPSQSFYTSANTIEAGGKVTATLQLRNVAAWNVKITSNGSTRGCDSAFADATSNGGNTTKNLSVTCTSTGVGQISFRVTGDATSADGSSINISGVKVVTVSAPRPKDSNNNLKSLGVQGYTISPSFNKDTLEYYVDVPSTVDKVVIEASSESGYASVRGTGEVEVEEGSNAFDVVVTSETGVERTYKLTVNVKDENPIPVSLKNGNYTVVKNTKNITKPELYEETTVKIGGVEVPAFKSDITGFTLVAVKDDTGKVLFVIYDSEHDTYQQYNEKKSANMVIYITEPEEDLVNYIKTTIEIDGISYPAFKVKEDSAFAIVYGMNVETGKKSFYVYYAEDNTFQLYDSEMIQVLQEKEKLYGYIILGGACGLIVLFFLCIFAFVKKPSKRKLKKYASLCRFDDSLKPEKSVEVPKLEDDVSKSSEKKDVKKTKSNKKNKKSKSVEDNSQTVVSKEDETKELHMEDALEKMASAEEIIHEYEKTMALSKKELQKAKEQMDETEEMYDLFEDSKKRKKRK